MNLHHFLLILHLIAATIWVGGHIILCFIFLPKALKNKAPEIIIDFEKQYGPVGMPALFVLIVTGVWMAYDYGVPLQQWFAFSGGIETVVSTKLMLLFTTFAVAIHAQKAVIPKLSNQNLKEMALHILAITIIGIAMLVFGSTIRFGGF